MLRNESLLRSFTKAYKTMESQLIHNGLARTADPFASEVPFSRLGDIVNLSCCQPDFADENEYEWLPRLPVPS